MKKLISLLLTLTLLLSLSAAACAADYNLSSMTWEELLALKAEITAEQHSRGIRKENLCGIWTVAYAIGNGKAMSREEMIKENPSVAELSMLLNADGTLEFNGTKTTWSLSDSGIIIDKQEIPLLGDYIVLPTKELAIILAKDSTPAENDRQLKPVETTPAAGIRPEFKEAMDTYEAFYDDYVNLMKRYTQNPTDFSIIGEYMSMLTKVEQMDKQFESWEDREMTTEELKYYMEVTLRIEQKMLGLF